jgi:MoxR-like ATPase
MSTTPSFDPTPSIEFACTSCGRALKVPATAAGRRATCPQCSAVVQIPLANMGNFGGADSPAPGGSPATGADSPSGPSSSGHSHSGNFSPAGAESPNFAAAPAWGQQPSAPQPPNWGTTNSAAAQAPFAGTGSAPATAGSWPTQSPAPHPPAAAHAPAPESMHLQPHAKAAADTPTKRLFDRITAEISKLYVGQDELVLGTLVALFSSGHVLIESVPGLGKTLFVRTLGKVLGCQFGRIQFTADLMPSDVTGAPVLDMKTQDFRFRPGPVFTQLLLADEINRAPAKTHAALLEIMQEYRVTVDGKSHNIDRPFIVLATQNPIESEGTYNLPEAQLDRFMFKLLAEYPRESEEAQILKLHSMQVDLNKRLDEELQTICSPQEILATMESNSRVRIDDRLVDYINKIVRLTRQWPQFHMGASPRAGLALMQAARTLAAFSGRDYAVPDDVFQIALPALRHRVILTAEAEVEGHRVDDLLTELIRSVEVPRL